MRIDVLTLFPEMCRPPLEHSIMGRAAQAGLVEFGVHDIREHGHGKHRVVDATPYGGGSGMVMRVDVVDRALQALRGPDTHVVLTAPSGARFDQSAAERLSNHAHLVFLCGHYEGIDGRVREHLVDEALSIGDYVLTGGELAALVMIDAAVRLKEGVLGNPESLTHESFQGPQLEGPCYTRPQTYRGWEVPEVLRSGHHARIEAWRQAQALERTRVVRPDLLAPEDPSSG